MGNIKGKSNWIPGYIKDAIKNTYAFFIARLFAGYKKCQRHIYKVEIVKDFNSVTESPTKIPIGLE
ncbi:MAG: hypothetical protein A2255_07660 [Candidatus Melainabacteria bacterium RIFOXYA2_FULL_32_9]|nr:MAG: hypothetical protein A2255_07660 [Candidatus Melainabacteria bacterium RIFOXYA2_FULL_32_9]